MAQSVKLSNGNFIDAGGVYDANTAQPLEDAIATTSRFVTDLTPSTYSHDQSYVFRQGRICTLNLVINSASDIAENTVLLTLPEGFRPAVSVVRIRATLSIINGLSIQPGTWPIYIYSNGQVLVNNTVPANTWVAVNVTYMTD